MRKRLFPVFLFLAPVVVLAGVGGLTVTAIRQPQPPTFSDCAGSLIDAVYGYRVSAINVVGETTASLESSTTLSGSGDGGVTPTRGVIVKWTRPEGAAGYRVYGRTPDAGELITTIYDSDTTSFCDTGSITPSGGVSGTNTTGDSSVAGIIYNQGSLPSRRTLPTCAAALEGLIASDTASGGTTSYLRTKTCVCTSNGDPDAGVAYAWTNLASAKAGTSTTCGDP